MISISQFDVRLKKCYYQEILLIICLFVGKTQTHQNLKISFKRSSIPNRLTPAEGGGTCEEEETFSAGRNWEVGGN